MEQFLATLSFLSVVLLIGLDGGWILNKLIGD